MPVYAKVIRGQISHLGLRGATVTVRDDVGGAARTRALEIERAFVPGEDGTWKEGAKRYLFFMLNEAPDANSDTPGKCKGVFYDSPDAVRECVFLHSAVKDCYPASFRWFVLDPTARDEMLFITSQQDEPWDFLTYCNFSNAWWYAAVASHRLHTECEE